MEPEPPADAPVLQEATPPQQCHWFLTHFHADHYKGLTSK
jgi:phosphoribosyl 1,2-cyclic phosphodiesterase